MGEAEAHGQGGGNERKGGREADPFRQEGRDRYRFALAIPTRWMDNDLYGHVNNVVYYSYFDTVINSYLIAEGGLDIHGGPVIGIAAESTCRFYSSVAFPTPIDARLRVDHLGRSSARYQIGLFVAERETPFAAGSFVHVFVERDGQRPVPIPDRIREALERLRAPTA